MKNLTPSMIFVYVLLGGIICSFRTNQALSPKIFKYSITIHAGHDYSSCGGYGENCAFMQMGGGSPLVLCHIPCWGSGNSCSHTIEVGLSPVRDQHIDGIIDTRNDGFSGQILNLPSRSVYVKELKGYLNIPQQLSVIYDYDESNPTYLYSVSNLIITDEPVFNDDGTQN